MGSSGGPIFLPVSDKFLSFLTGKFCACLRSAAFTGFDGEVFSEFPFSKLYTTPRTGVVVMRNSSPSITNAPALPAALIAQGGRDGR